MQLFVQYSQRTAAARKKPAHTSHWDTKWFCTELRRERANAKNSRPTRQQQQRGHGGRRHNVHGRQQRRGRIALATAHGKNECSQLFRQAKPMPLLVYIERRRVKCVSVRVCMWARTCSRGVEKCCTFFLQIVGVRVCPNHTWESGVSFFCVCGRPSCACDTYISAIYLCRDEASISLRETLANVPSTFAKQSLHNSSSRKLRLGMVNSRAVVVHAIESFSQRIKDLEESL